MHVSLSNNGIIMYLLLKEYLIQNLYYKCPHEVEFEYSMAEMLNISLLIQNLVQIVGLPTGSGVPGLSGLLKGSLAVTGD
jgi:hypothetical protein